MKQEKCWLEQYSGDKKENHTMRYSREDLRKAKSQLRLLKQKIIDTKKPKKPQIPSLAHLKVGAEPSFGHKLVGLAANRASSHSQHTKLQVGGIECNL